MPQAEQSVAESTSSDLRAPMARDASGSYLRRRGRDFVVALYGALRAIKLYPAEHTAVKKTLAELAQFADEIVAATGWLAHTARGAMSGALGKKLGLVVASEKDATRGRVYRLPAV